MTDRAAPGAQGSTVRNMEYGEMGGSPAPYLHPLDSESRAAQRWDAMEDLTQTPPYDDTPWASKSMGPFQYISTSTQDIVSASPGEGYVDGWFATDEVKEVDISPYQQEEVTVVVGWDPDAVYSSDIHNTREEADKVFIDVERNVDSDVPYIPLWSGTVVSATEGGFELSNIVDHRPIGRPVETLAARAETDEPGQTESNGPGVNLLRGRPTAFTGGAATGPQEAPLNALRAQFAQAPVNSEATQGDTSILTMLQSAGVPAAYVERILDGAGGAYGHQFEVPLGRLSRINSLLSWEVEALSDSDWQSAESGDSSYTFSLTGFPREAQIDHDGSSSNLSYGTLYGTPIVTPGSIGSYRVTFHDVEFSNNANNNQLSLGVTDNPSDPKAGSSILYETAIGTQASDNARIYESGSEQDDVNFNNDELFEQQTSADITLEYTVGGTGRFLWDGVIASRELSYQFDAPMSPFISSEDDDSTSTGETVTVSQVTVEPLSEVLH